MEYHTLARRTTHDLNTNTIRTTTQPNLTGPPTIDPYQRMGDSQHSDTRRIISLLDYSGSHRSWTTTTTTIQRRPSDLSNWSLWASNNTLAVQTTIPNTRHTRQTKEHHVGERLAPPHRRVADVFASTPSYSNDPNITQNLSHRPNDKRLAQQPLSVRTPQQTTEHHTHATT